MEHRNIKTLSMIRVSANYLSVFYETLTRIRPVKKILSANQKCPPFRVSVNWREYCSTNIYLTGSECAFVFEDLLKHSCPSCKEKEISFRAFPQNLKYSPTRALTLSIYKVFALIWYSSLCNYSTTIQRSF